MNQRSELRRLIRTLGRLRAEGASQVRTIKADFRKADLVPGHYNIILSISFGVATASLATAFFISDRFHTNAPQMIDGIHKAFLALGGLTVLSSLIFRELKEGDGNAVSGGKVLPHVG